MSNDEIIEEFEKKAETVYKDIPPVKIGGGLDHLVIAPKSLNIEEPKLKEDVNVIDIKIKEHDFVTRKPKNNSKKPPDLW